MLAGLGPRAVEQVALPMANALAFTLERKLGVTDAVLAVLDDDQLSAVCARAAHLGEPRRIAWRSPEPLRGHLRGPDRRVVPATPGQLRVLGLFGGILAASVLLIVGLRLSNR